jgi:hypothetical protein
VRKRLMLKLGKTNRNTKQTKHNMLSITHRPP